MAHNSNSNTFNSWTRGARARASVMFTVTYEDGRTAYLVAEGHGGPDQDYLALPLARERQQNGELPEGVI